MPNETLTLDTIVHILATRSIGVEYQPIIALDDESIAGYEALSRFFIGSTRYPPNLVFEAAHHHFDIFFLLEAAAKEAQLSFRPEGYPLFINMDPHLLNNERSLHYWQTFLRGHCDITVEIIENLHGCDPDTIEHFLTQIAPTGCRSALDDFGQEGAIYFSSLLEKVDIIKFDRAIFLKAHAHAGYCRLLEGFIGFAHANGQQVVIEGIESKRDLELAKKLQADYVQGYYFRDRFISKNGERQ
jgi:EAL domain-containing protein (putative c-di-GMP-specific phosphodiesterase class I)